ncbi:peptidyl-dipeptidase Dcp [Balneicella halophila]|uniref:oligopeptidase A n=1 Tax=Balneicella halophila TaxID=1537566 RepID=A0A7L4UPL6_BALHA|nr:M3 family metallopeptidase [Balneicella halophila]PVX50984.1 peptidyl-dipeptidase Dcp [Balneicella halophila]
MKLKNIFILLASVGLLASCNEKKEGTTMAEDNPFAKESTLAHGFPDFANIEESDYAPAFEEGIKQKREDIDAIVNNSDDPTFDNTIVAMERSGKLLRRVSNVFFNITSAETNDNLRSIEKDLAPKLSKLSDDIKLNEKLFERIKAVKESDEAKSLGTAETRLLDDYYKDFVRGGANLNEEDKEKLREINKELSLLSIEFGDNVLKENNKYELVITDEKDLAGLPQSVIDAAKATADEHEKDGWMFTIHKPSLLPFLTYADNRELRKEMFMAYINKGNGGEFNNKEILKKMVELRIKKANLLGYPTHAHFILEKNVAKNPDNVKELLNKLWTPALEKAKEERAQMQAIIKKEGGDFDLEAWDWWYYADKIKQADYSLDEEALRPYFQLKNVRDGVFIVAERLFGIKFTKVDSLKGYHPDVEVFEVTDSDGSHLAMYMADYFPRPGKSNGAWMNAYRKQSNLDGKYVTPIITNVCNFTKPVGDKPALLSLEEVQTLFHEFGHALHGMLSDGKYPSQTGTSVSRDFVELPSQVLENWAMEPKVMKLYAKHYKTGETIPDELIAKIRKAGTFNQGFATTEYLAASLLDMEWHSLTEPFEGEVIEFEENFLNKEKGLIPEIVSRYRSPYFSHIFAGGYSAGYYGYIWAEVYDADTYSFFKETDVFDQEKGMKFRNTILSQGGSVDSEELYREFRGQDPDIEALIEKRGLK